MQDISLNSKRIARNTFFMYVRMIFLTIVNLYTSRVILQTLGVTDFGIYNVVGGIVLMFAFISSPFSLSISRFLTYELPKGDKEKLQKIFSTSILLTTSLAIIICLLSETVGVWFLNNRINIPENRQFISNIVFQFSILTFCFNLFSTPYNALLIAHEKMSVFAYISILEGFGKLAIVFLLLISPVDRLVFYSMLMCFLAILIRLVYSVYCKKYFDESKINLVYDKPLIRKMFEFSGWNFIGAFSYTLKDQGVNILLNVFFGVTVNAARGIAMQVQQALYAFSQNFATAIYPQITKSYSIGDYKYENSLIERGSRFSFYLLFIVSAPVIIEVDYILKMWLHIVPNYCSPFVRLVLITSLIDALSNPVMYGAQATGNIKLYQIVVGLSYISIIPISYIFTRLGIGPVSTFWVVFFITGITYILRLYLLKRIFPFNIRFYVYSLIKKIIPVIVLSLTIPVLLYDYMNEGILRLFLVVIFSILSSIFAIGFCGCYNQEKSYILSYLKSKTRTYGRQ